MRGLVYALLLENIAFFGWARWIDVPPAAPPAVSAATLPVLALADTADGPEADHSAVRQAIAAARCRSLGPFAAAATAATAAGALRKRGLAAHERRIGISAGGQTHSVYWIDVELQPGEPDPPLAALVGAAGAAGAAAPAFSDCPAGSPGG
jgi:hypothetical protein